MTRTFTLTPSGIKSKKIDEKTFFVIDAKDFLQTLFENFLAESIRTLDKNICSLITEAAHIFKTQYEIKPEEQQDLFDLFYSLDPKNIQGNQNLMEAHEQSIKIKKLLNSKLLSTEEKRIVCLSFFNDSKLISIIDSKNDQKSLKNIEKSTLMFKKMIKDFFKKNNANNKSINIELNKHYPKEELPVFDALLDDLVYSLAIKSATTKAYKTSQILIPLKKKNVKTKIKDFLSTAKAQTSSSFGDK